MSLDQARAAQADRDARHPDASWHALPGQLRDLGNPWDHLRAALAEVDRLTVERDVYATRLETAEDVLDDCRRATDPEAEPESLPKLVSALRADAHRWATIRDEVRRLDAIHRPGAVMDDDDIMDTVIRVLRRVAGSGGSNG